MRHTLPLMFAAACCTAAVLAGAQRVVAQELVPRFRAPAAFAPAVPLHAPPFSRNPETRARQAVSRQLAVIDWVRWQSNAWHLYGPDELWLFGPPLTFAWDFPPVEQPIGFRRTYDGRGGYSSGPIYADEVRPRPVPPPIVVPPSVDRPPDAVLGSRQPRPARAGAPVARAVEAPRRLFSW